MRFSYALFPIGVAYVEFDNKESVVPAIACSGSLIQGIPIIVQDSQAEKNRIAAQQKLMMEASAATGPTKLYVGNLHHNVGEDELREMFSVFGEVESINIIRVRSFVMVVIIASVTHANRVLFTVGGRHEPIERIRFCQFPPFRPRKGGYARA